MSPLTWHSLLITWNMPVAAGVLLGVAALAYAGGVAKATRWPVSRTIWFFAGLTVTTVATGGAVEVYSDVLFSMHMAQHLLLIMVAPAFLVFGRPAELLRVTARGGLRRALSGVANSRWAVLGTHPLTAFALYTAVVVGTHLTPFQQSALIHPWLHGLEEFAYLASGYLLLAAVLPHEPLRRPWPPLLRLLLLLPGMAVDTVVGISLMMTPAEPFPAYAAIPRTWGPAPLQDLHWGGAIMWVGGDALMAAVAIVVITDWVRTQATDLGPWLNAARRSAIGRGLDENADLDGEEALRAYNEMLAALARDNRR
ncbi:cytochrome c oxidase assembly protein [Amycolatopsis rhizosphaerae]|uniref:Cytochrome c oxidase assembly protein n=1 Tax=Amycolatopsis rhizosphaerae TaxID=2053003 RepID=A0A558AVR8_9PSEU|nr:cytochrome c oxidase assembly protein [Amycolatopsis rhizosphaerae]TVT28364.1 cytochrome c oxidase assembly protein [Amycolatopsis rhizosphaerae]